MAEFAPVGPHRVLQGLKDHDALGKYHLLLAHDVVEHEEEYHRIFDDQDDVFVIMDNSVIELGEPVSGEIMRKACNIVDPNLVVLPDYIACAEQTYNASLHAAHVDYKGLEPFLAVPQGLNYGEFTKCADRMLSIPGVRALSIPRHATAKLGTRMNLIWYITSRYPEIQLHLLGFSDDLEDDIRCARCSEVMGIDSAVPLHLGDRNIQLTKTLQGHPPRGNWWDTAECVNHLMLENLETAREWIK